MKNAKMFFLAVVLLFASSCDDSCFKLLKVIVDDDTLKNGEKLELNISATDCNGIESIAIEIPILNVDLLVENTSDDDGLDYRREWIIDDANLIGTHEITVTVKNKAGEEKIDLSTFSIN